ncbi:hypothetical protein BES34_013030 [Leptospira inadai serovar Lyme]|uniref:Uncharacterized protein n=1 Tax=Leptospira inadai serovar Lyme TaxID=293084 RepID=A0ABX4YCY2_9LEPT|nr:hypothetical protein BES34_020820 [Leptospira inadai serovar Lyme]PNV74652.1 hypothetical protein BES34_013030 [Leptospira inadai serovar Lyme]
MEIPLTNVLSSAEDRGQRSEDRCIRFAHARQKLLEAGKVIEVGEKSTIMQESFFRTWKLCLSMFCPLQKTEDRGLTRSLCSR